MPAERLLIETDCLYGARALPGQARTSDMIALTARAIASARGIGNAGSADITRKTPKNSLGSKINNIAEDAVGKQHHDYTGDNHTGRYERKRSVLCAYPALWR